MLQNPGLSVHEKLWCDAGSDGVGGCRWSSIDQFDCPEDYPFRELFDLKMVFGSCDQSARKLRRFSGCIDVDATSLIRHGRADFNGFLPLKNQFGPGLLNCEGNAFFIWCLFRAGQQMLPD